MKRHSIEWWVKSKDTTDNESLFKKIVNKNIKKSIGDPLTREGIIINKPIAEDSLKNYEEHIDATVVPYWKQELGTNVFSKLTYTLKDNFCLQGFEATAGSKILEGYTPTFNATIANLFLSLGIKPIGKSVLNELGMGGTGLISIENGKSKNQKPNIGEVFSPWHKERIVGGSSSGSCFSVSIGAVPFSIGSDTGDSVRKPAGYNGIVGYKPSYGAVSRWGLMPYAPSLDTVSWFTHCVKDARLLLKLLAFNDQNDSTNVTRLKSISKKKIVIGFDKDLLNLCKNKEMIDKVNKALKMMEKEKSFYIKEISFSKNLTKIIGFTYKVFSYVESLSSNYNLGSIHFGRQANKGNIFSEKVLENRVEGFGDIVKRRFALAWLMMREEPEKFYWKAAKYRNMIQKEYEKIFNEVDIFITPTSSNVAPRVKDILESKEDMINSIVDDFAAAANLNGNPSISIPVGYASDLGSELPFSISLDAKFGNDYFLLDVADKIEKMLKFKNTLLEKSWKIR